MPNKFEDVLREIDKNTIQKLNDAYLNRINVDDTDGIIESFSRIF